MCHAIGNIHQLTSTVGWPTATQWVYPGHQVIGSCSKCGDAVTVPGVWGGITPPTPTCSGCGAKKKQDYGPVVEMQ